MASLSRSSSRAAWIIQSALSLTLCPIDSECSSCHIKMSYTDRQTDRQTGAKVKFSTGSSLKEIYWVCITGCLGLICRCITAIFNSVPIHVSSWVCITGCLGWICRCIAAIFNSVPIHVSSWVCLTEC